MKIIYPLVIVLLSLNCSAQDPSFSHFRNSESYINPAWVGSDSLDYAAIKYRNQWPGLSGNYFTTAAVYSHSFTKLGANVFTSFTNDIAGDGILNTNRFSAGYAHRFDVGDFKITPAAEFTYQQKRLDWTKITFGDAIDPRRGFIYETVDTTGVGVRHSFDMSAGLITNYKGLILGSSFHHINQPNESLLDGDSPLPFKLGLHALYMFKYNANWQFTPSFFYEKQAGFIQTRAGLNVKYKWLEVGAGVRSKDAFLAQIGVITKFVEFFYSYDQTTSNLSSITAGSHELSIRAKFLCK